MNENPFSDDVPRWKYRLASFQSKAQAALAYLRSASSRRSPVLDARHEVLATLVNAYLKNQSEFEVYWVVGERNRRIVHPGLEGDYQPEWSHVQALVNEGQLELRETDGGSVSLINIPTHVLDAYIRGDPLAVNLPPGRNRIHALRESPATGIVMNVHGGNVNVANASSDFSQTVQVGIQAGDLTALLERLRTIGVSPGDIASLKQELESTADPTTQKSKGSSLGVVCPLCNCCRLGYRIGRAQ